MWCDRAYVPPIVFTDFRVFGEPVEMGSGSPLKKSISYEDDITLSHAQSTFSVEFSDSFTNRYRYQLDGVDPRWNETGNDQRMVNYASLLLETTRFMLKHDFGSADPSWNRTGVAYGGPATLIVVPPFCSPWRSNLL